MKLNCLRKNQNINTTQAKKFIFRLQIKGVRADEIFTKRL